MEAGLSLVIVCVDLPIVVLALNTKGFFAVAATFPHYFEIGFMETFIVRQKATDVKKSKILFYQILVVSQC